MWAGGRKGGGASGPGGPIATGIERPADRRSGGGQAGSRQGAGGDPPLSASDNGLLVCAVTRRHSSAGANPARQLSLQPVAVGADDGGNDIGRSTSMTKGRFGWLSDDAGCNAK